MKLGKRRHFIIGKNNELPRDCFAQLLQIPAPSAAGAPAGQRPSLVTVGGALPALPTSNRRALNRTRTNPTGALIPLSVAKRQVPASEPAAPWDFRELGWMGFWFSLVLLWGWW